MKPERLDTAGIFEQIFSIYRRQASVLLPAAAIVFLVPAAIIGASSADRANVGLQVALLAVAFIANFWFQGMVIQAVNDIRDGKRDLELRALFTSVAPVFGTLMWVGILGGLGIAAGLLLFIVPGLILLTQWCVGAPVVVMEGKGPVQALGRSRELVRGHGWQVFSVLIVTVLIQLILSSAFGGIAEAVADSPIAYGLASLLGNTVTAPIMALAVSVLYLALTRTPIEPAAPPPPGPEIL